MRHPFLTRFSLIAVLAAMAPLALVGCESAEDAADDTEAAVKAVAHEGPYDIPGYKTVADEEAIYVAAADDSEAIAEMVKEGKLAKPVAVTGKSRMIDGKQIRGTDEEVAWGFYDAYKAR